jgi:hypothetical protein
MQGMDTYITEQLIIEQLALAHADLNFCDARPARLILGYLTSIVAFLRQNQQLDAPAFLEQVRQYLAASPEIQSMAVTVIENLEAAVQVVPVVVPQLMIETAVEPLVEAQPIEPVVVMQPPVTNEARTNAVCSKIIERICEMVGEMARAKYSAFITRDDVWQTLGMAPLQSLFGATGVPEEQITFIMPSCKVTVNIKEEQLFGIIYGLRALVPLEHIQIFSHETNVQMTLGLLLKNDDRHYRGPTEIGAPRRERSKQFEVRVRDVIVQFETEAFMQGVMTAANWNATDHRTIWNGLWDGKRGKELTVR